MVARSEFLAIAINRGGEGAQERTQSKSLPVMVGEKALQFACFDTAGNFSGGPLQGPSDSHGVFLCLG
jgi:hypothetical protein